jgi:Calcium-activated chloride channel
VGITILNLIYTFIAKWFVQLENHKYRGAYEDSLIYKNVLFKLINSYLSIFYFMFKSDKSLKDLFYLMLPVLIVKQVNYMLLSVFVPQALYQREENKYFRRI